MTFGGEGRAASRAEAQRILGVYLEAGGSFIDTANNYGRGESERTLGELIGAERERLVLASKYTAPVRPGDPTSGGNHRRSLRQSLEGSLKRLRTDYIDLYWVHAWDGVTPVEELMRALDDAVRAGKVLYVGISNAPAWVVSRANMLAELSGWSPFVGLQIEYSLIERTVERELIPMADALGLSVLAWGPLGGGLLSGKYLAGRAENDRPRRLSEGDRRLSPGNLEIAAVAAEVAGELGRSPAEVALAWLLARPCGRVIPIVGARTGAQLTESLGCVDLELTEDQRDRLDRASRVRLGFPHEFLASMRRRYAGASDPRSAG
jgi:aryl-alcohol dehydrogenase-like predicted oxidoreductase